MKEPRISPFDSGGQGLFFVYLSNRNHCSFLFSPEFVTHFFQEDLYNFFPMGYSTLFLLEKLFLISSGKKAAGDFSALLKNRQTTKGNFAVVKDPATALTGGSAISGKYNDIYKAIKSARIKMEKQGASFVVARILDSYSWH